MFIHINTHEHILLYLYCSTKYAYFTSPKLTTIIYSNASNFTDLWVSRIQIELRGKKTPGSWVARRRALDMGPDCPHVLRTPRDQAHWVGDLWALGRVARREQNSHSFRALEVGGIGEFTRWEANSKPEKRVHTSPNLTFISPKKTYRWPKGTWKGVQYHWPSGKCKSKTSMTSHLTSLRMAITEKHKITSAGKDKKKSGPFCALGRNVN